MNIVQTALEKRFNPRKGEFFASTIIALLAAGLMQWQFGGVQHAFFGTMLGITFTPSFAAEIALNTVAIFLMADAIDWVFAVFSDLRGMLFPDLTGSICTLLAAGAAIILYLRGNGVVVMAAPNLLGGILFFLLVFHWTNQLLRALAAYAVMLLAPAPAKS